VEVSHRDWAGRHRCTEAFSEAERFFSGVDALFEGEAVFSGVDAVSETYFSGGDAVSEVEAFSSGEALSGADAPSGAEPPWFDRNPFRRGERQRFVSAGRCSQCLASPTYVWNPKNAAPSCLGSVTPWSRRGGLAIMFGTQ
jgi:hypothetical protein